MYKYTEIRIIKVEHETVMLEIIEYETTVPDKGIIDGGLEVNKRYEIQNKIGHIIILNHN